MTTHDHQTEVPRSHQESQTASAGTPPVHGQAPSATVEEQREPSTPTASAEPPTASGAAAPGGEAPATEADSPGPGRDSSAEELLFADDELAELRGRWAGVQAAFVDDPKECVQKADVLVSDLVEQLTTGFAHARSRLEEQWARGEEASTEDLRMALMHYREFFERLLAV